MLRKSLEKEFFSIDRKMTTVKGMKPTIKIPDSLSSFALKLFGYP